MEFIDAHAHLNSQEFKENWRSIVTTAKNNGVSAIINNASDISDSEWSIVQANQEPIVYATVGIHPEFLTGQAPDMNQTINNLRRLINSSSKVVAIGELGLDYTLDPAMAPKQAQMDLIIPQLQLAQQLNLPVVMHVRDQPGSTECFTDAIHLLQQFTTSTISSRQPGVSSQNTSSIPRHPALVSGSKKLNEQILKQVQDDAHPNNQNPVTCNLQPATYPLTGQFHCWTGTPAQAEQALTLGFYISFSGILTYKTAGHILDAAKIVPSDRLLIETDSPFLTPEPARSREHPTVNQPKYVILTAEKLAAVRDIPLEEIAQTTTANAKQLFKIK